MVSIPKKLVVLVVMALSFIYLGLAVDYNEFDYFKFIQHWPASYCNTGKFTCAISPFPDYFTIHGLWPANFSGIKLEWCYEVRYTPITDPTLLSGMTKYWPNVARGAAQNEIFWSHQWQRHGTCSLIFYFQMGYFDLAIDMITEYDLLGHLMSNGIIPSATNTYSVATIRTLVTQLTTKDPDIRCNKDAQGREQLLDIPLCFDPDGEIMDCTNTPQSRLCRNSMVYFPLPPGQV